MKKKVRLIPRIPRISLLSILVALAMMFTGCGSTPSTSEPASSEPASTVVQTDASQSEPEPEPEPEPLSPFDTHVTDYQTLNDVLLIDADASIKEDFFNELYLQDYTKILAAEDKETVTDANAPLLDEYIDYLNNMHETCEFDNLVNQFITENPDTNLSEDATPLYEYLRANGMDSYYVQTRCCDNEYVNGFIAWDLNDILYDPNGGTMRAMSPDEIHSAWDEKTEEEKEQARREFEELQKELEEWDRQMEEEARIANENVTSAHGTGNI